MKKLVKCITFDKEAQDALPQDVKDKMAKQRAEANAKLKKLDNE